MRGWRSYFGFCETPEVLIGLTRWFRLRLRAACGGSFQCVLQIARAFIVSDPYARCCGRGWRVTAAPIRPMLFRAEPFRTVSAPIPPGIRVSAPAGPESVETWNNNKCAVTHPRCHGRGHERLNLEHYLDVLERKPGAMADSTPLAQWRAAGRWPECLGRLWQQLEQRHCKAKGTKQMIGLVREGTGNGWSKLIAAVEEVSRIGVTDGAAVLCMMQVPDAAERHAIAMAEELRAFERPMPTVRKSAKHYVATFNGGSALNPVLDAFVNRIVSGPAPVALVALGNPYLLKATTATRQRRRLRRSKRCSARSS